MVIESEKPPAGSRERGRPVRSCFFGTMFFSVFFFFLLGPNCEAARGIGEAAIISQ